MTPYVTGASGWNLVKLAQQARGEKILRLLKEGRFKHSRLILHNGTKVRPSQQKAIILPKREFDCLQVALITSNDISGYMQTCIKGISVLWTEPYKGYRSVIHHHGRLGSHDHQIQ